MNRKVYTVILVVIQIVVAGVLLGASGASKAISPSDINPLNNIQSFQDTQLRMVTEEEVWQEQDSTADTTYYFYRVNGSSFIPESSSIQYDTTLYGCIKNTTSGAPQRDIFRADIHLPEGALIDYVRVYYYDASTDYVSAAIKGYQSEYQYGTSLIISSGYGYDDKGESTLLTIQNNNYSYVAYAELPADANLALCSVRIRYTCEPPSCTFLPMCYK